MRFLSLRAMFLLAFVIAMPVLALPPVARWLDEVIHGPSPTDFGRPPGVSDAAPTEPIVAESVAPAGHFENSPAQSPQGLDTASAAAPPLAPPLAFAPVVPPTSPPAPDPVIDAMALARLQQIRERLEELGADYVVVDSLDGAAGYRCLCRMLVDPRSRFTRPFEATAADPLTAGELVLREVEAWHMASVQKRAAPR